jgi:hypothetical protein
MPRRLAAAAIAAATWACGGAAPPAPTVPPVVTPPPPVVAPPPTLAPEVLRVTVLSASIDGKKPDGSPWDEENAALAPPAVRGSLAAFLASHRELEGTTHLIGEPVDVPGTLAAARKSSAPDPVVYLETPQATFRTTLAPGQFQPVWRFPFLALPGEAMLRVTVVDWDGPAQADVIGDTLIPLRELAARPIIELPRFGNVERLTLEIAPAGALAARRRVAVAGRDGWIDSGLDLVAGQEVIVRAAGEVCSRGADRARCAGPEGQPQPAPTSLPGFEARPHAGLVGAVGDVRFFIGRELRFRAASSGHFLLGVNDSELANNSGELEVDIELR